MTVSLCARASAAATSRSASVSARSWQDIRMLEPMRKPRFALEVGQKIVRHRTFVRNLQSDV
jgi:hypothetical protein